MTKEEKCSISQKNRIVIHKQNEEKRIYKSELDEYLESGWCLGISEAHREQISTCHKGQKAWNKGKHGYLSEEARMKLRDACYGRAPWNKGLSKETDERVKVMTDKSTANKRKKYGNGFGNNNMDEPHRQKISAALKGRKHPWTDMQALKIKLTKEYITKKKNKTFNTSKPEEQFYTKLLEENKTKTIYRQYKDERYPFYCDFYIVEDDLFIELNLHRSHGGKPFDPNDPECIEKLATWTLKAKTSQFYANAIQTWTVRDVQKAAVAKKNHLNYKVIY